MHYYKSNNEIMQYCIFSNDIALIMHYRALLKRSDSNMRIRLINLVVKNLGISSRIIGINSNILINLCLNLGPTKCIQFFVHLSTL